MPPETPHPVDAAVAEFVGDEPVAEHGVAGVNVADNVDQVYIVPITLRDKCFLPVMECLRCETEGPADHRDRRPFRGQVEDQRKPHAGGNSRAKNAAAQDLVLPSGPFTRSHQLGGFLAGQARFRGMRLSMTSSPAPRPRLARRQWG